MGIHLMPPLYKMVIAPSVPPEPDLYIEHDPPGVGHDLIFVDDWYGNTFMTTFDFKLAKIALRHSRRNETQCATGRLDLREQPFVNSVAPALIETSYVTLPALPTSPVSVFVEYPFNQPLLLANTMYSFFARGCSLRYNQPRYRINRATVWGFCPTCCLYRYREYATPPHMDVSSGSSQHHKIWGYPV